MTTQSIGETELVSSRLAYGCMRIAGTWNPREVTPAREEAAHKALLSAYEAGYTLFDHADIYCRGECEAIHGRLMHRIPSMRRDILIATKCGIRFPGEPISDAPHRFDFSKEHILEACDASLARLGIETIDLYQLHRADFLMNPEEVADAFAILHRQGKVRYFGVSNFPPSTYSALQAWCPFTLVVNQVEIHLGRLNCFYDGTLDQCLEKRITPLSWSPLGGGFLGSRGRVPADHPKREGLQKLIAMMDAMSKRYGVSRTCIALAWLLKHPSMMIPIVGSANPEHIRDAVGSDSIEMSREDWYRLLVAARMEPLP